jgi:hypothetical protein
MNEHFTLDINKQRALNYLLLAIRLQCPEISNLYYCFDEDNDMEFVTIKYNSGDTQTVNVSGDSIIAMLGDVLTAVRKHA